MPLGRLQLGGARLQVAQREAGAKAFAGVFGRVLRFEGALEQFRQVAAREFFEEGVVIERRQAASGGLGVRAR
ncbi:MAG: hypothetical protein QM770_02825 [Tepidisphaeraceae bacterium]